MREANNSERLGGGNLPVYIVHLCILSKRPKVKMVHAKTSPSRMLQGSDRIP